MVLLASFALPTSRLKSSFSSEHILLSKHMLRRLMSTSNTIPAAFWRGGTSNALMIHRSHLPSSQSEWQPILAGAIGSPDNYKRQLNGMGGGISSLSKVCVISPSEREDADVDYTFIQMGVTDGKMDMAGACGNMMSAVGPFAVQEAILKRKLEVRKGEKGEDRATVRIYDTNMKKIVHSSFAVMTVNGEDDVRFHHTGDYSIDGVSGTGSRIELSFLSPGGAKTGKTLPTGNPVDTITLPELPTPLSVTLVDAGNPAVIINAADISVPGDILPTDLDADTAKMDLLERIRREGARLMGLDPEVQSIPKMVMVSSPPTQPTNGMKQTPDLIARVLSMQNCHKATPITIALNLGVACQLEGTIPQMVMKQDVSGSGKGTVVIGHPSGTLEVGAVVKDGVPESAVLHRTARPLMRGEVYWR